MIAVHLALLVVALACLVIAALAPQPLVSRVNFGWLGLALWIFATLLVRWPGLATP